MSSTFKDVQKSIDNAMKDIDRLQQKALRLEGIIARIRSMLMTNAVNSGISWQERQACKNMLEHLDKLCADTSVEPSPSEAVVREYIERLRETEKEESSLEDSENADGFTDGYSDALRFSIAMFEVIARKHGLEVA